MISKERLGAFGAVVFAASCAGPAPTPAPDLDSFVYRTTIEQGEGKNLLIYSDSVEYPKMQNGANDVLVIDVFCPDEQACEDFLDRDSVSGSNVSLGRIDPFTYSRIEFTNQWASYISCGKPVPEPFEKGEACPPASPSPTS